MVLKVGHFGKQINTWKDLRSGAENRMEKMSWTDGVKNEEYYIQ
jgi:hypothetical protein